MRNRIVFLDNLRTFLILAVVVFHSGNVYKYGFETKWIVSDPVRNNSVGLIGMIGDLVVMFLLFFIAGYFSSHSAGSKNPGEFIFTKFKHLMIPWAIAVH